MKKFILLILLTQFILAKEVYFMPQEGKKAEKRLAYLYTHAHKSIKIAIYSFTNKKLSTSLKKAAKKGVKIYIVADKKEARYKRSVIPNLATIRNINIKLISGKRYKNGNRAKMHVKLSIIDDKYIVTGSANYSYSAFYKNYEYLIIEKDKELIKRFNKFFDTLSKNAKPYRLSK
ncbi:MAG: phospholipase D-like domain-containing protein [Nautiliaceae bacterium]